jgi:uncharacterized protein (TIGR02231 family)
MKAADAQAPMAMAERAAMEEAPAPAPARFEAETLDAGVDSAGAAVTYRLQGRASIPSDGEPHKVIIARFPLSPRLDYVSAPRLAPAAHRRARVTNESAYIFLPGAANLFAGDEFLGASNLDLTPPGGEVELFLGVEDRLRIERELKRRDVDKSLIGGRRRVHYAYEITLENLLPREVHLVLHDQIPVPQHEDIKVRLEGAEPRPTTQSELNLLDWELNLPPGRKFGVRFDFTVEHPQGMEIVGLP